MKENKLYYHTSFELSKKLKLNSCRIIDDKVKFKDYKICDIDDDYDRFGYGINGKEYNEFFNLVYIEAEWDMFNRMPCYVPVEIFSSDPVNENYKEHIAEYANLPLCIRDNTKSNKFERFIDFEYYPAYDLFWDICVKYYDLFFDNDNRIHYFAIVDFLAKNADKKVIEDYIWKNCKYNKEKE